MTKKEVIRPLKYFGHLDIFFEQVVVPSGYDYFEWNGLVYKVNKEPYDNLGFKYDNLAD